MKLTAKHSYSSTYTKVVAKLSLLKYVQAYYVAEMTCVHGCFVANIKDGDPKEAKFVITCK